MAPMTPAQSIARMTFSLRIVPLSTDASSTMIVTLLLHGAIYVITPPRAPAQSPHPSTKALELHASVRIGGQAKGLQFLASPWLTANGRLRRSGPALH